MKLLFVCNQNENRSKTAEHLFKDKYETRSAGLYNEHPITEKDMDWADIILVMEDAQRTELANRFPKQYLKKKILSLNIPDTYHYNQPSLIKALNEKLIEAIH
jgi:predicted protein tyrosine phosphatase